MLATIAYGPHAFIQGELLSYNKRDNIGTVGLDGMTYTGELVTLGLLEKKDEG